MYSVVIRQTLHRKKILFYSLFCDDDESVDYILQNNTLNHRWLCDKNANEKNNQLKLLRFSVFVGSEWNVIEKRSVVLSFTQKIFTQPKLLIKIAKKRHFLIVPLYRWYFGPIQIPIL